MKILQTFFILVILFSSCVKEKVWPYPCLERPCVNNIVIDPRLQPNTYVDENDYHHIEWRGIKYFTLMSDMSDLHPSYLINGVPMVAVGYDSDTWVLFDTLTFHVPMYNILGNTDSYNNPISVGNDTISLIDLAQLHAPLNIVGYQINKAACFICPVSPIGTSTLYSYKPRQQIYLRQNMVGDTIQISTTSWWNVDKGPRVQQEVIFNIVVD
jgi:hypothetical protein